ncbi:unnamed protein product [Dovyalis caffra]|uniref:Alpha/beta-Hydrolases superfamily protein n=1 Tax=Dovyalis caffra TaxID=77055 RepID=A0AAV1S8M0_9ROSI|nr:unnamed protein product [Dovyalis caffra]
MEEAGDPSRSREESSTPFLSQNGGLIPQLFTSVPSLNEAAFYLAQSTSLFTRCFSDYSVEYPSSGDSVTHAQELATFSSTQNGDSLDSDCPSSSGSHPATDTPPIQAGGARTSSEGPSQDTGALVQSNNSDQSGLSMFQGLIERARRTVRGSADDIGWLQRASGMPPVEDGTGRFMEILDNIRVYTSCQIRWFIYWFQNSSRNIGDYIDTSSSHLLGRLKVKVLNRHANFCPVLGCQKALNVTNYTFFLESMVCATLLVYLSGLFSNHGPLYFVSTKTSFSKMGLTCHIAKIHSEASVGKNARELKEYIEEIYWGSQKRVMLLGHSKGGVDAAAALSLYWSDLKDKVAGLALAQSPYGGSPIASDILREGQLGDYVNIRRLMEIIICKVIKGDMQALEDLTYERRKEFLTKHQLPRELPVVSFHTEAGITPAVLATLSHVAHAEFPLMAPLSSGESTKLPVVVPLGAAMAACAQLLQIRYGEKSDGLVTCRDAEVPGSTVVRPKRKLDHAWMVYSSLNDDPSVGDASQVCEALLTLLVEVGQRKRHEFAMKDE